MIRAVVDTSNHVKAVLFPTGSSGAILDACAEGIFRMVCSESILKEIADVLSRQHIQKRYGGPSTEAIAFYLESLRRNADIVPGQLKLTGASPDPNDDHVLACAIEGGAEYVVSADKAHLLMLKEFNGVLIVSAHEFLKLLRASSIR